MNATTQLGSQPAFPAQLTTAISFVNACRGTNTSIICEQWRMVIRNIAAPQGVDLHAPPLPITPEGSKMHVDGETMHTYLDNYFAPRMHGALMKRAQAFLELEPQTIRTNLEGVKPALIQSAMDAKLISGNPADVLLKSARLVHDAEVTSSNYADKAWKYGFSTVALTVLGGAVALGVVFSDLLAPTLINNNIHKTVETIGLFALGVDVLLFCCTFGYMLREHSPNAKAEKSLSRHS